MQHFTLVVIFSFMKSLSQGVRTVFTGHKCHAGIKFAEHYKYIKYTHMLVHQCHQVKYVG